MAVNSKFCATGFCAPLTWTSGKHVLFDAQSKRATRHGLMKGPYTLSKRARPVLRMEQAGGERSQESSEPTPEVEYFGRTNAGTPPDMVPSLPNDPASAMELPLFPLQLVLSPGTSVPLHIFETRYRLMFNRLKEGDGRFGIVLCDGQAGSLALVGCTAEVVRFDPLPDGRIMTNNIGKQRFRIVRIVEEKPYLRAKVEPLRDVAPAENLFPVVLDVWQTLQDVLRLSNKLYEKGLDLSPDIKRLAPGDDGSGLKAREGEDVPDGWPSPALAEEFSFAVCQVLDMPLKEQQIMLQMTETAARLRRQNNLLSIARQYLAAQVTIKEAGLKGF